MTEKEFTAISIDEAAEVLQHEITEMEMTRADWDLRDQLRLVCRLVQRMNDEIIDLRKQVSVVKNAAAELLPKTDRLLARLEAGN